MHWISPTEVWIIGAYGTILRSLDLGATWSLHDKNRVYGGVIDSQGAHAWLIGGCGMIVRTELSDVSTSASRPEKSRALLLPYPNPNEEGLVHWACGEQEGTRVDVRVLNLLGACVFQRSVTAGGSGALSLSVGSIAPGSYVLMLSSSTGSKWGRLEVVGAR